MGIISEKYAKALAGASFDNGQTDFVQGDFINFAAALKNSIEFDFLFFSPRFSAAAQQGLIKKVITGNVTPTFESFINVLIKHGREKELYRIHDDFVQMSNSLRNKAVVKVTTAVPISKEQTSKIRENFSIKLGKEIEIEAHIDESLIGGVVFSVGDTVIDNSISASLDALKKELSKC